MTEIMIGPYSISGVIGNMCNSIVYFASDKRNSAKFALKYLNKNENDEESFVNEVGLQRQLNSPLVAEIYDAFSNDDYFAIVTKYYPEGDLHNYFVKNESKLSLQQKLAICYQMVAAVKHIRSQGICHFDIKLDNFLVTSVLSDGTPVIALTDFGSSEQIWDSEIKWRSAGTTMYSPPEYHAHEALDINFDIFSLGVSIAAILTGKYIYPVSCAESAPNEEVISKLHELHMDEFVFSFLSEEKSERINPDDALESSVFDSVPMALKNMIGEFDSFDSEPEYFSDGF